VRIGVERFFNLGKQKIKYYVYFYLNIPLKQWNGLKLRDFIIKRDKIILTRELGNSLDKKPEEVTGRYAWERKWMVYLIEKY